MKNHLGEQEYRTYTGWQRAIRKRYPDAKFRIGGNSDICFALASDNGPCVGEWTGDSGVIYLTGDDAYIPKDH